MPGQGNPVIQAIGGIAPEPVLLEGACHVALFLLLITEQQYARHLKMLESEQVSQRAVHLGQASYDLIDDRPFRSWAVIFLRHGKLEQAAVTQYLPLRPRRAACALAFDGIGRQCSRYRFDRFSPVAKVMMLQVGAGK